MTTHLMNLLVADGMAAVAGCRSTEWLEIITF